MNDTGAAAAIRDAARGHSGASAAVTVERIWGRIGPALGSTVLPFALVLYLGLQGGGYDDVVRGEVGIAIWWIVLLGAVVGVLPRVALRRAGWIAIGLFAAFGLWTALSLGWSESSERSMVELGKVSAYGGILVLALAAQGREGLRRSVFAVGGAIAVIAVVALLSRLHPAWFPANELAIQIPSVQSRLAHPLGYWNGLAALLAMGLPLLLVAAVRARTLVVQATAAAAIPALVLAGFFTFSRGGIVAAAIALAVLFALAPGRLAALPTLLATGAGSVLLIAGAAQRDALEDGLFTPLAHSQGDEMIAMTLIVCLGVGLIQAAIGLAVRHGIGPRVRIARRPSLIGLGAAAAVAVVVFFAAGGPSRVGDAIDESTELYGAQTPGAERLESASLSGRDEFWGVALDAGASEPLTGIGPGTYEFWWAREGTVARFVRDAHSLYLETFAELGVPGLALILAVVGFPLLAGARRALRAAGEQRALLAAALGGCAAFAVSAAIDWTWELAVLPAAFLLLCGAMLVGAPSAGRPEGAAEAPGGAAVPRRASRVAIGVLAIGALVAIAVPLASTDAIRASEAEVERGQLDAALADASAAERIQPFAATPELQRALVLELQNDLEGARSAAVAATEAEPTNWRTWLVLSRLEARLANAPAATDAFERARELNPRSPIFDTPAARGGEAN